MPLTITRQPDALRLARRAEEAAVPATVKTVKALKHHLKPDGEAVGAGGTYDCREAYAIAVRDRGLVEIVGDALNPEAQAVAPAGGASTTEGPKEWTMRLDPAAYLERYPDGPAAEQARQIIALENAKGSTPGADAG